MRIQLLKNNRPQAVHIVWGPMAIVVVFCIGYLKEFVKLVPSCVFHDITGVPCLTCGGTRSAVALSQFNIPLSLFNNPLVPLFAIGLIAFSTLVLAGVVLNKNVSISISPVEKRWLRYSIFAIIGINWLFLILSGR